ncbi:TRAP transporter substrate-binding protein DctP [Polymorphobacter megasporae]|uniref:TRAP transporter substrate-binding protein DctP n=1 Tax=Glacieibacterium megasporae TaxID=2835787 RepID=UPI001C1E5EAC|nr:TRAP transporter substrate-binding protein DctP [Polymorphobacter megasporae]UAJ11526.1 TRAP transporter substrate-binding protein DctP [Polymorphobacter megasporae]
MTRWLLTLFAAACALAGCARPDPNVVTLSYATPYPPTHPFSQADRKWIDWVEAESHGRIKIAPFWGGAILSSDQSMEEVRHGVADIGLIAPIYTLGNAHAQRAQVGFYGHVGSIDEQVGVYKCLIERFPVLRDELRGLRVLAVQGGNLPGILTRNRPVHSLADLRGLRLRAPAENTGVLRVLGADPVDMPMGNVYSALAKGVIDGVVAPADTLKSLNFAEVAHHFVTLRISRGAYPARAMNEARWRSLPPDLQALLARSQAVWERALADKITGAEKKGRIFGAQQGVVFSPISPADQARFDTLYNIDSAKTAASLSRFGIAGLPIFDEAQRLIGETPSGIAPACAPQGPANPQDPK